MPPQDSEWDKYLSIWEKAVDTQMHFNEMSVKSRQLGLTFVAGALGVAVVLLSQGQAFSLEVHLWLFSLQLHVAVLLVLGAYVALRAVKLLDLNVYHKMLRGAVSFGEDLEENYLKGKHLELEKGMTQAISHFSRYPDAKVVRGENGRYQYTGESLKNAESKISEFYSATGRFLVFAAAALFLVTNLNFVRPTLSGGQESLQLGVESTTDQNGSQRPLAGEEAQPNVEVSK
ncbi:hypothetical protein [Primorskyibacter flagellatus]|uniref:Uncharacterized protein n=1 Tax=Primorskyibacter flagellatus TaxID=1387277 RepID=A0A1W2ETB2_9RHOB|nr:hypothetical protein [Primorskyibacter flagellatus]SMD12950.1 hypothetical protein SAMN06295998_1444 [Primorskyibacter flagellatus]